MGEGLVKELFDGLLMVQLGPYARVGLTVSVRWRVTELCDSCDRLSSVSRLSPLADDIRLPCYMQTAAAVAERPAMAVCAPARSVGRVSSAGTVFMAGRRPGVGSRRPVPRDRASTARLSPAPQAEVSGSDRPALIQSGRPSPGSGATAMLSSG